MYTDEKHIFSERNWTDPIPKKGDIVRIPDKIMNPVYFQYTVESVEHTIETIDYYKYQTKVIMVKLSAGAR